MQDELYLSGWEIEEISKTLTKYEDEVNTLVEKAASERAARYAYDHPKLPKGFVTITQLQGDLDLGDLRDEVEDFDFDGDITDAFSETADYKVDDNYHDLLTWLPDHTEWLEQAEFDGLLEGCKGDIYKMVQMAQYECFKSDLYDHREDICRYGTLDQLRDMGVYAIRESLADEILNDLSYDEDYAPTDDAKDTIMGAVSAAVRGGLRRSRDRLWTGYRRYRRSRKPLCPECGYGTRRERKGIRRGVRRAVEGRAF